MSHPSERSDATKDAHKQLLKQIFSVAVRCSLSPCQDEISALRRRLEKSERERNELRQTADSLETKVCVLGKKNYHTRSDIHTHTLLTSWCVCVQVTAVTSELSDERFRGDAVGQALDVERAERLRLSKENKELQVEPEDNRLLSGTTYSDTTPLPSPPLIRSKYFPIDCSFFHSQMPPFFFPQARLDQCKVTMGTLEKQLEEERQRVQAAESQRGAGTGKHQRHHRVGHDD